MTGAVLEKGRSDKTVLGDGTGHGDCCREYCTKLVRAMRAHVTQRNQTRAKLKGRSGEQKEEGTTQKPKAETRPETSCREVNRKVEDAQGAVR